MRNKIYLDHSLQNNVANLVNTIRDYLGEYNTESAHYNPIEFAVTQVPAVGEAPVTQQEHSLV